MHTGNASEESSLRRHLASAQDPETADDALLRDEHKGIEEQLERSNQKLNEILDSIQDDLYVLDRDWNFVYTSRSFTSKIGKEPKDFVGKNIWTMFPKHMGSVLEENFHAAMEKGETRRFEIQGKYSAAWYRITAFPSAEGITVLGTDITEHKRAEEQLRELSQRLTYHVDNSPLAVIEWGSDMRLIRWSGAAERMFGWKAEEILGKRIEDFRWVYEEDFQQVSNVSTDLQTGTKPWRFSANRNYRKDGSIIYCEWYNSSLMDQSGNLRSILSLVLDVTDRTRMERELAKSEERYRHLVKYAPTGIYEIDLKTMRFIEVNDSMCRILGYTREELMAMMPDEFLNEEGRQRFKERMSKTLAGATVPRQTEYIVKAKDGHEMWALLTTTINYGNGNPRSVSVVAHDITERKRAEDTLRKKEEQLQLLNETLEQKVQEKTEEVRGLASNVVKAVQRERQRLSHILHDDLQQRIYAIQMQLSFLRDELPRENESARTEVVDIEQQLGEVRKIARDLSIDLSPPILHDEGLAHAIHWLASQMQQQYGLKIELHANEAFVIPDEELHVLLFNSVRELLFNVVKHAEASHAVVTLQWSNGSLRIEICDDGKGFPVDMLEEPLSEETSSDEKWHLGFGLSTIRHQLSLFGGSMEIESNPGAGTQVTLTVSTAE